MQENYEKYYMDDELESNKSGFNDPELGRNEILDNFEEQMENLSHKKLDNERFTEIDLDAMAEENKKLLNKSSLTSVDNDIWSLDKKEFLKVNPRNLSLKEQERLVTAGIHIIPNCTDPKIQFTKNMDLIIQNHIPVGIQKDFHKTLDHIGYAAEFLLEYLDIEVDPLYVKNYCEEKADSRRVAQELTDKFYSSLELDMGILNSAIDKTNDVPRPLFIAYHTAMEKGLSLDAPKKEEKKNYNPTSIVRNAACDALACYARLKEVHQSRSFGFMVFSCRKYYNEYKKINAMENELKKRFSFTNDQLSCITTNNTPQVMDMVSNFYMANTQGSLWEDTHKEMKTIEFRKHEFVMNRVKESLGITEDKPLDLDSRIIKDRFEEIQNNLNELTTEAIEFKESEAKKEGALLELKKTHTVIDENENSYGMNEKENMISTNMLENTNEIITTFTQ